MKKELLWETGVIAICGPTCGGKSTLERALLEDRGGIYEPIVSTTTRAMRPGEVQGRDYRFVSKYEFSVYVERDMLIEWDEVSGEFYGVEKRSIERLASKGKIGVAVVTPKGLAPLKSACLALGKRVLTVYVSAASRILVKRLMERARGDRSDRIELYAARLEHLFSTQRRWRKGYNYEIMEENFDADNMVEVISRIRHATTDAGGFALLDNGMHVRH